MLGIASPRWRWLRRPRCTLAAAGRRRARRHLHAATAAVPDPAHVFRTGVELITTDVIVRDSRGQFIADLKKDEFEVFEDGVKQELVSFTLTHGGRVYNLAAPPPPPPQEGIILPPTRPTNDAAGRIFLIFVDDLHLDFRNTGASASCSRRSAKELIHEGDMFGIVSTGPSSLAIDLTYDRSGWIEAINEDHRLRAGAEGHHRRAAGRARPARSPLPRARRVLDGVTTSSPSWSRCTTAARRSST